MISLKNKIALITGGSRGIGAATVQMFAEAGADVAVNYTHNEKAAAKIVKAAESFGAKAIAVRADVSIRSQVDTMVNEVIEKLGRIDILVNNAGIWEENPIDTMTEDDLRRTVDINILGTFFPTMAVVPHMKRQKSGIIINISSTAGQRGEADHSPYAASKSAVIGLTKSLAPELVDFNIRVNCVAPGWVDTDMARESLESPDASRHIAKIPMGRPGQPEELAGPILFMASDLATFITGEVLNVNGGAVLCG